MKKILPLAAACVVACMVIAQDDLVIPIDELGTEEELLEWLAEHYGDDVETEITPELSRVLEAIEASDDDELREVLSDIAGEEVRLPDEQVRFETPHKVRERFSTDEILARMRPEHVEALTDHRHLLDDERQLFFAIDDMEGLEHAAALEFIAKMTKPEPFESMRPPELRENLRLSRERGWYDMPGPAMGSHLLREVERLGQDGAARLRNESLEFDEHREHIAETSANYSFDYPGYERMEVFSETKFGGVLYVEKTQADYFKPHEANLFIAGHDGTVTIGKHADGGWVTNVSAFDGRHLYQVVIEKKLQGAERAEFVRMATELIEGR